MPGTLLLVDDEDVVRAYGTRALTAEGFAVTEAQDGTEALRRVEERGSPFDLVIADVLMPRMNGAELAEALLSRNPRQPILLMSGYPPADLLARNIRTPGLPLLQKPFTPDALVDAVRGLLWPRGRH
ncbi:MAG TPA: response regulator [Gemmatimonadales bacterium]|nr:response regulator [Gemmatimonadales bacterium]